MFLSHTSELRDYPKGKSFVDAAEEAVLAVEGTPLDMKHFPARDQDPAAYCKEKLKDVDVYVGIIGFLYGTLVPSKSDQSYTELEFETATGLSVWFSCLTTNQKNLCPCRANASPIRITGIARINFESGFRAQG